MRTIEYYRNNVIFIQSSIREKYRQGMTGEKDGTLQSPSPSPNSYYGQWMESDGCLSIRSVMTNL